MSNTIYLILGFLMIVSCSERSTDIFDVGELIPWCIVAYDSLERTPEARMEMLRNLGFKKYAYDWRDKHLDDMEKELGLVKENDIELVSVWLWMNAQRDSLNQLSPANERIFETLEKAGTKTTIWLSFSNNFFEDKSHEESMEIATELVEYVWKRADSIGCDVAIYNHRGWFGEPENQVEIVNALPQCNLKMIFNFHHGREYLEKFSEVVELIVPYVSVVNLNGTSLDGPEIMTIGSGEYEKEMIQAFIDADFKGYWGILGHIGEEDVEKVLLRNVEGLQSLNLDLN